MDGRPIGVQALRYAWKRATRRAGVPGRLIHDLRRGAARDFIEAGVDRAAVKLLCGWETDSVFERYLIRNEANIARAVAKRFNGKVAGESEPSSGNPDSVTSGATT